MSCQGGMCAHAAVGDRVLWLPCPCEHHRRSRLEGQAQLRQVSRLPALHFPLEVSLPPVGAPAVLHLACCHACVHSRGVQGQAVTYVAAVAQLVCLLQCGSEFAQPLRIAWSVYARVSDSLYLLLKHTVSRLSLFRLSIHRRAFGVWVRTVDCTSPQTNPHRLPSEAVIGGGGLLHCPQTPVAPAGSARTRCRHQRDQTAATCQCTSANCACCGARAIKLQ